jgi:hypothetical protein
MDKTLPLYSLRRLWPAFSTGQDKAERSDAEANPASSNQCGKVAAISLVIR